MTERTWGGRREGAGRKSPADGPRKQHAIRANEREWEIIKAFEQLVKSDYEKAQEIMSRV